MRVEHFNPGYSAGEVFSEVGAPLPVLACRTVADAIAKDWPSSLRSLLPRTWPLWDNDGGNRAAAKKL
jgi:hypothetical protein